MDFTIDSTNYKSHLTNGYLVINDDFIKENAINPESNLVINGINDMQVSFGIINVDLQKIRISIKKCSFEQLFIQGSVILELIISEVEISSSIGEGFAPYKTIIDSSKIERLWIHTSKFFNSFLVRKQCEIIDISIWETNFDRSFTFLNSTSNKITIESSNVGDVNIERSDYPVEGAATSVENINIFRTTVSKNIKLFEVDFKNIHFHKIKLNKIESLTDHYNEIYITIPRNKENHVIDEIKITESEIRSKVLIGADKIKKLIARDSELSEFSVGYWRIDELIFLSTSFSDSLHFGAGNRLKDITKFVIESCIFKNSFSLNRITFEKECQIKYCIFEKYPSVFNSCDVDSNCITDFTFTNLKNFVFQDVDFTNFYFKNLDISNAEFDDCSWKSLGSRNLVVDEAIAGSDIQKLIRVKDIYAKLKLNCQKNSDFKNYGRFYISEQEIKRRIFKLESSWLDFVLLSLHKWLSEYGENFKKPLLYVLLSLLLFSWIYLFTGFFIGERFVQYEMSFNLNNTYRTFHDYLSSFVFSLKSIAPFTTSLNFFIHSDKTTPTTQTLELFHKLFNVVFAASFTAALIKQLRK